MKHTKQMLLAGLLAGLMTLTACGGNGEKQSEQKQSSANTTSAEALKPVSSEASPDAQPEASTPTESSPDTKPESSTLTETSPDTKPEESIPTESSPDTQSEVSTQTEVSPDTQPEESSLAETSEIAEPNEPSDTDTSSMYTDDERRKAATSVKAHYRLESKMVEEMVRMRLAGETVSYPYHQAVESGLIQDGTNHLTWDDVVRIKEKVDNSTGYRMVDALLELADIQNYPDELHDWYVGPTIGYEKVYYLDGPSDFIGVRGWRIFHCKPDGSVEVVYDWPDGVSPDSQYSGTDMSRYYAKYTLEQLKELQDLDREGNKAYKAMGYDYGTYSRRKATVNGIAVSDKKVTLEDVKQLIEEVNAIPTTDLNERRITLTNRLEEIQTAQDFYAERGDLRYLLYWPDAEIYSERREEIVVVGDWSGEKTTRKLQVEYVTYDENGQELTREVLYDFLA